MERARLLRGEAHGQLAEFTEAIHALAEQQTGALVVFEQHTGLKTIEATGVPLDSELSGPLIQAIFFPKSPLHDGAVVVREGRIVAASCMLPLSDSLAVTREMGTRHRAALGITEESDAIAVVVSEETGRMSIAHRGVFIPVTSAESLIERLTEHLEGYDGELQPA